MASTIITQDGWDILDKLFKDWEDVQIPVNGVIIENKPNETIADDWVLVPRITLQNDKSINKGDIELRVLHTLK